MGNCLAVCKPNSGSSITNSGSSITNHGKVVRVEKPDGKVLEFRTPTHVKDILVNFPSFSVSVSKEGSDKSTLVPPEHELKPGRLYYLIPISRISTSNLESDEGDKGVKRIKVVITKQQLEMLVTKQISFEDILSSEAQTVCVDSPNNRRKPKLESIPEENE